MAINNQQSGGASVFVTTLRPFIIALSLIAMASGLLAFFCSLICIIKYKERSPLVYATLLIGLFALILVLGELLFPH